MKMDIETNDYSLLVYSNRCELEAAAVYWQEMAAADYVHACQVGGEDRVAWQEFQQAAARSARTYLWAAIEKGR